MPPGPTSPQGILPKAACSGASELLREPRRQDRIAAYLRKADITVERVLEEIRRLAFSDLREVATWALDRVPLRSSDELTDEASACIAEVIARISPVAR
jgi:hypothetical protein